MEAPSSKSGTGVTFERKKELTKALNDKIKLFVEHIEAKKIETPIKELMIQFSASLILSHFGNG